MMLAALQPSYGGPDVIRVAEVARPTVGPDDVLVKVRAASLNFGDRMLLTGRPWLFRPLAYGLRRPLNPVAGMAAAGVVVGVGAEVSSWAVGDPVFGELGRGALAEYVLAKPDELARKPEGVRFEEAATVPVAGTTALQGLDAAGVQAGHRVLVNGASGGVGTFAVQIARARGARVTAVCRGANAAQARALGAEAVIDYTAERYVDVGERFDLVLDLVGNHSLSARMRVLDRGGVYVASFGRGGGGLLGPLPRIVSVGVRSVLAPRRVKMLAGQPSATDLATVVEMMSDGAIRSVIEARYSLAEAARAYRHLVEESVRGKIVVAIDDPLAFGPR